MIELTHSIDLDHDPASVFALAGDPMRWPEFEDEFESLTQITGGGPGVGAAYRYRRKIPGKVADGTFVLTRYEEGSEVAMAGEGFVGPFRPTGGYTIEPTSGGCRLVMRQAIEVKSSLKLLTPLFRMALRREGDQILQGLRTRLDLMSASG